jgi:hypothetical protein
MTKRVRSNYHALQVLKTAHPKLRKAIIANCDKELVNCISECVLNVLTGNLPCDVSKLRKHKVALRSHRQARLSFGQEETHRSALGISAASTERDIAIDRRAPDISIDRHVT